MIIERLPPGSVPWLLVNELRLAVRNIGGRRGRARSVRLLIGLAILVGFGGWGGWMLSGLIAGRPAPHLPLLYIGVEAGMVFLTLLMLSQTLVLTTQAFFERNDLDLLLSSPLPPGRVLTVRSAGVAVAAASLYTLIVSVLVIPLALRGDARGLAAYVVLADLAMLATSAGLLLALALFRLLGAKRTRVVSQVLAAVIGASAFLAGQSRNLLSKSQMAELTGRFASLNGVGYDPDAVYAWPARALLGDPGPLLGMTALCALLFWTATTVVGRRFGADAAAAAGVPLSGAGSTRRRTAQADRLSFSGGPLMTLARKDGRLLIRDPWLLSQLLLQMVWFVPLGVLVARSLHNHLVASAAGPIVFFTGQLAGNLAWVVVSAEDSPELIVSAPVGGWDVVRAKLLVALGPVAVVAAVPIALLLAAEPLAGLSALLCGGAAWLSVGLMNVWYAKPAKRREMMRRQRSGGGLMGLVEMLILFGWSGSALLGAFGQSWALLPPVIIAGVLFLLRRPTIYRPALA